MCVCECVCSRAHTCTHPYTLTRARAQVHTFRFNGHSPADPEHERGRKQEKKWARDNADPIAIYEQDLLEKGIATQVRMCVCMYVRMQTCMCVCVHDIACWVRLSCGAGVDFAAPLSCVRAQTHTHEEGRGKKGRKREGGRQGGRPEREKSWGGDIKEKSGAARHCRLWLWRTRPQRLTRALDRRRSLMRSRQRRARRARTPSSSRTSRPPPPLPWRRSLSSPTPQAPITTSRPPPRCVCVCVCVCLCACVLVLVLVLVLVREFGAMGGKGEIGVGYPPAG